MSEPKEPTEKSDELRCSSARPLVIYATEIEKQPDELIEAVRNGLVHLRGQLHDIRRAYGWDDRIEYSEGAITALVIALAHTASEFRTFREKHGNLQWKTR